ncbi:hypothetical protein ACFVTY_01855 [Streptomyces sp. NPDC058067]|uniref:hypothetical protein n=1 Tax=Streptomyces sp. NPDC058067 TaxID=3346324 RepID=UPI0036E926B7
MKHIIASASGAPTIVAQRQVVTESKQLTVSTIRIAADYYDTVIFDDSADKRHAGMSLGGYVIDSSSKRATDREAAMDQHREALIAARTEEPWPPNGGHDVDCAYVGGIGPNCNCSPAGGAS